MDMPQQAVWLWTASGVFLLFVVITVVALLWSRPSRRAPQTGWKGFIYYNPDDPALFVAKRWGIGWTLNFANRWAWVYVVIIAALTVGPFVFVSYTLRHLLAVAPH